MTRLKRAEVKWASQRKKMKFVAVPRSGHKQQESMPLVYVLRDILNLAESAAEARKIIKAGQVAVDGKVCKDPNRGVGLFDTVILAGKTLRVLLRAGRLTLIEIPAAEAALKICQVIGKRKVRGGKIQLSLHDGRNILIDGGGAHAILDSVLLALPMQTPKEYIPLQEGVCIFARKGAHSGQLAVLKKIEKENGKVWIERAGKLFEVPLDSVIPIGEKKPLITIDESAVSEMVK